VQRCACVAVHVVVANNVFVVRVAGTT